MPSSSLAQARLMRIAAHHPEGFGGVSQSVGREFYNADKRGGRYADGGATEFDTPLTDAEKEKFAAWKSKYAPNDNGTDYDLAGAFKAGLTPDPQRGHFPDTFKKPNHPTFSAESKYSTPEHQGGVWSTQDGHDVFTPSPYDLQTHTPQELQQYFQDREPSAMLSIESSPESHALGGQVGAGMDLAHRMAREHFAAGGAYNTPHPGFGEVQDYRSILSPTAGGVIASEVPGRTDHIPTSVAADSYVIPADIVSGVGEGNTLAGARAIQEMLSSGPHGIPMPRHSGGGSSMPRPPAAPEGGGTSRTTYTPHFAAGGTAPKAPLKTVGVKNDPNEVPVVLAGGEMVIDPHVIAHHPKLGNLHPGDKNPRHYRKAVDFGHKVMDAFVLNERKKLIKTLSNLPGPKRS